MRNLHLTCTRKACPMFLSAEAICELASAASDLARIARVFVSPAESCMVAVAHQCIGLFLLPVGLCLAVLPTCNVLHSSSISRQRREMPPLFTKEVEEMRLECLESSAALAVRLLQHLSQIADFLALTAQTTRAQSVRSKDCLPRRARADVPGQCQLPLHALHTVALDLGCTEGWAGRAGASRRCHCRAWP